jgi:hypothetical protein
MAADRTASRDSVRLRDHCPHHHAAIIRVVLFGFRLTGLIMPFMMRAPDRSEKWRWRDCQFGLEQFRAVSQVVCNVSGLNNIEVRVFVREQGL